MKKALEADDNFKLWWLIAHSRRAMSKARAKELLKYDITLIEAGVLFIINACGKKATPAEVSRWTMRESHSVSGLLMRMEKTGLINRVKDPHHKNIIRLSLTRKGRKAYTETTKREVIGRILNSISDEERTHLKNILGKLQDIAMKEADIKDKPPFPDY